MGHLLTAPHSAGRQLFWRVCASCYDHLWDMPVTGAVADAVVSLAPVSMPVIEVGAGTGLVTAHLARSRVVTQVSEPDPAMRARLAAKCLPVGEVIPAHLDDLQPALTPRCVVAVNVVHLLENPEAAERHLQGVAGVGGRVILVTPAAEASAADVVRAALRRGAGLRWAVQFIAAHLLLVPLARVVRLPHGTRTALGRPTLVVDGVQEIHLLSGSSAPG